MISKLKYIFSKCVCLYSCKLYRNSEFILGVFCRPALSSRKVTPSLFLCTKRASDLLIFGEPKSLQINFSNKKLILSFATDNPRRFSTFFFTCKSLFLMELNWRRNTFHVKNIINLPSGAIC